MQTITTKDLNFNYFTSGEKPKLLIHSGTHGDEAEVTEFVLEALEKYEKDLPPFIFVPQVSLSAVAKKTRRNASGSDMNRHFFSDSEDSEVMANIAIIKNHKFDLFVSFHEDPLETNYYVYDVGFGKTRNRLVLKHNLGLREKGVGLLNGVDDLGDSSLGYVFVEGYNKLIHPENYHDDGTISAWVLNRRISPEYMLPEIPGKVSREIKRYIVESFFSEVILKSF